MRKGKRRTERDPLSPDYKTPVVRLFEKPYTEWTKKQREWLDVVYQRLFPSPRGRKAEKEYDNLFHERETAKVNKKYPGIFGESERAHENKIPSYTELASRAAGAPVSAAPEDEDPARQRFIRAYQRRKKRACLPDPPEN
jgi:hypothetical protein